MLRLAVSMLSLTSCLGDAMGNERLVGQVGLVQKAESRAAALAGFQKFADKLVAQYKADGKELDDTTKQAINTVIVYIDTFYPSSQSEHDIDVNRVDNCPGSIESCVTDYMNQSHIDIIETLKSATQSRRDEHSKCRSDVDHCEIEINQACHYYDHVLRPTYASLPSCVQPFLSDDYIQTDDDDDREKMEGCLETFKGWFDPLYDAYSKCKRGQPPHCMLPPPENECDSEQHEFESEHCEWTMSVDGMCRPYEACVAKEEARCAEDGPVCSDVAINVGARKADNETGERIKCLLSVLVNSTDENKPDDLATCVNATYNTDHFDITCPARIVNLNPPYDCNAHDSREAPPCGVEFLNDKYPDKSFPNAQYVRCNCRVCEAYLSEGSQRPEPCEPYQVQ